MNSAKGVPQLKVSRKTKPSKLGGAIAKYLGETDKVAVRAMGDRAVYQAVKGVHVAQTYLATDNKELDLKLHFQNEYDKELEKEITFVVFYCAVRK